GGKPEALQDVNGVGAEIDDSHTVERAHGFLLETSEPSRWPRAADRRVARLAPRSLVGLVHVRVGQRLERVGPGRLEATPVGGGTRAAVPADLLHVVVE